MDPMGYHIIIYDPRIFPFPLPPYPLPPPKKQAMLTSKGVRPKASMTSQLASVILPMVAHL